MQWYKHYFLPAYSPDLNPIEKCWANFKKKLRKIIKKSKSFKNAITIAFNKTFSDYLYVKLKGGMVYLDAIIDWYSRAVLSWRISNTIDSSLVMSVLHEALDRFGSWDFIFY